MIRTDSTSQCALSQTPIRCRPCCGTGYNLCASCKGRGQSDSAWLWAVVTREELINRDELQARRARVEREALLSGGGGAMTGAGAPRQQRGDDAGERRRARRGLSCASCAGRGRVKCTLCKATGLENNWLFQPKAEGGGWGPRGQLLLDDDDDDDDGPRRGKAV